MAQNLGPAARSSCKGIQRGQMSLHARNIALAVGAIPEELADVMARLIKEQVVRQDHAEQVLAELRKADTEDGRRAMLSWLPTRDKPAGAWRLIAILVQSDAGDHQRDS